MADQTLYRCTPRQTRKFIIEAMQAGLVPSVTASPGVGKSEIMASIGQEFNLTLLDERLSTREPVDLSGFAMQNETKTRARYMPLEDFVPLEGLDSVPKGKEGWLLFFDEFNSAPLSVQAAAYKLILDRKIGRYNVHPNVLMACAGNLSTDRAITNRLSTAMQSRLVHIEMEVNFEEWLEDVAFKRGYDSRIIGFLNQWPSKLMDFKPDHQEKTFACPRTWSFVNRLIQGKTQLESITKLLAGTITSGTAVEFVQFAKLYDSMMTVSEIVKNPKTCPVPQDLDTKWAVVSHLMEKIEDKNYEALATYMDRFDMSFKVLFHRSVMVRKPELRTHKAFINSMSYLSRYMHAA